MGGNADAAPRMLGAVRHTIMQIVINPLHNCIGLAFGRANSDVHSIVSATDIRRLNQ
jgi:hypothetical protein